MSSSRYGGLGCFSWVGVALQLDCTKLILEVDYLEVVFAIEKGYDRTNDVSHIFFSISSLFERVGEVRVMHVFRKGNMVVDWFVGYELFLPLDIHAFQSPPDLFKDVLDDDAACVAVFSK